MSRPLPSKPNLEHLKSQAKDLLDAHRRGEPEAFARIRAAVPAFARMSDDALARAPFALHDAQSAIAREYGVASWAELRARVIAADAEPAADPAAAAREQTIVQLIASALLPPEAGPTIREALTRFRTIGRVPTPATVPVLPLRNAVVFPGAMLPIDVNRPTSLRALEAALATEPAFVAIFAQRAAETQRPSRDDLHTDGCLCVVLHLHRRDGIAWLLIGGVRWIRLDALDQVDPYYAARVADTAVERGPDDEIAALDARLREVAYRFVDLRPELRDGARAMIDAAKDSAELADLVMANVQIPVADKAAYAAETDLSQRLQRAIAVLERGLEMAG